MYTCDGVVVLARLFEGKHGIYSGPCASKQF
jgi:hypothetical protein